MHVGIYGVDARGYVTYIDCIYRTVSQTKVGERASGRAGGRGGRAFVDADTLHDIREKITQNTPSPTLCMPAGRTKLVTKGVDA